MNLLPPEIEEQQRFRRVQQGLGAGVIAAVVVVGLLYMSAGRVVSSASADLTSADGRQAVVRADLTRYRDVTATYKRAADAQALLTAAMGQEVRYSRFLNDLALTVPADVWLTNATYTQAAPSGAAGTTAGLGTISLTGTAYAHEDVAGWLEVLATEKGYAAPLLQSSTGVLLGTRPTVNWSITVTLTADALSGRYTTAGS